MSSVDIIVGTLVNTSSLGKSLGFMDGSTVRFMVWCVEGKLDILPFSPLGEKVGKGEGAEVSLTDIAVGVTVGIITFNLVATCIVGKIEGKTGVVALLLLVMWV